MFAFTLGCLYLISALIYLLLIKEEFNIFGFVYNPNNRKFLIIFDAPFLLISFAAIIEEPHWFLFLIFAMHAFNSMTLLIKPQLFYEGIGDGGGEGDGGEGDGGGGDDARAAARVARAEARAAAATT